MKEIKLHTNGRMAKNNAAVINSLLVKIVGSRPFNSRKKWTTLYLVQIADRQLANKNKSSWSIALYCRGLVSETPTNLEIALADFHLHGCNRACYL